MASWAASDLLGAITRVGFCTCSIVQAMVADLPEPVMPRRVWKRSPRRMPSDSASIALGWSPAGEKSDTTRNGGELAAWSAGIPIFTGMVRVYGSAVTGRFRDLGRAMARPQVPETAQSKASPSAAVWAAVAHQP